MEVEKIKMKSSKSKNEKTIPNPFFILLRR